MKGKSMSLKEIDAVMPFDPETDTAYISAIGKHPVAANAEMVAIAPNDLDLLDRLKYLDVKIVFDTDPDFVISKAV